MDALDAILRRPDVMFTMWLEPGDMQLINNHTMLHSRTDYIDYDDPAKKTSPAPPLAGASGFGAITAKLGRLLSLDGARHGAPAASVGTAMTRPARLLSAGKLQT